MKNIVILGAGTAGTMIANKLSHELDSSDWRIIIVDKDETHFYQPGFLFIPFGVYKPEDVIKQKCLFIPKDVELIFSEIELVEPEQNRVRLADRVLEYDYLFIASGTTIRPDEVEGLLGGGWQENIFDFYTFDGSTKLAKALENFEGGRLVVNVAEMPIKCPVAPLEFSFLADWYFTERGIRDKVDIVYSTPLPGAFTKPICSSRLGFLLENKRIHLETDFNIMEVDQNVQVIRSFDEREIGYDMLVSVPTNMGADFIEESGLGDELNFVLTNKNTLQSEQYENIWVIGDATNLPTSKAGSVAHFEAEVLIKNFLRYLNNEELLPEFDGHANCFIETGFGKGILVDFNYDVQPLPGKYPIPAVGPFTLLEESHTNHLGKMSFKWVYWNLLLKGRPIPVSNQMSMTGKTPEHKVKITQLRSTQTS